MPGIDESNNIFLAGAAKEDITPEIGTLLYGYVPDSVSTSVHDRLELTAAAFRQQGETALIISLAAGDLQTELAGELKAIIERETGIDARNILIAATHTHSAPNVSGMEGWGGVDRLYVDKILIPALVRGAKRSVEDMREAEIAVGVVRSEVGINRRQQLPDGTVILGQNPWGCFDPDMTCIAIRERATKKGILNIIHYGCHGTAAGNNREISRDWSGVMIDRLQRETGTLTTFVNGAIGDVGPRLSNGTTTGDITHVEELGGVAAADALRAYKALGPYKPGALAIVPGTLKIPRKPLSPRKETEAQLRRFPEPEKLINITRLEYAHYKAIIDEYEAGCPEYEHEFSFPQTVISLGDVAFIPFPFEIFSEICLRIKAYSPVRYTLPLSNVNGYCAYLPSEDQLVRGGYEVGCFRYSSAHPLVDNSDQVVIDRGIGLLKEAYARGQ